MKKALLISLSVHISIILLILLIAIVKHKTSKLEVPQFVQLTPDIEQVEKPVKTLKRSTTRRLKKILDTRKLRTKILTRFKAIKAVDKSDSAKHIPVKKEKKLIGKEDVHISAGRFPYLWYLTVIKTKLSNAWTPPSGYIIAKEGTYVRVCFRVNKNGIIDNVKIKHSSGMKLLDNSVLNAIKSVETLPALPSEWKEEYLNVSIIFKTL
ncbi:TonB C-terminal domain-containing protein [bacterium]|nr:TonB C-terminal domain-containing protein [bacterium]